MNLARLDMHQTFARLSWDIQQPRYTFEPAKTELQIEKRPAEIIIERTQPRLTIDQSQCWADMDCKHIFQRVREDAEDGKQAALEFVGRVSAEGYRISQIENKENPFKNLAREKALAPKYQFEYGNVPGNFSLKYRISSGETYVDWTDSQMKIDVPFHTFHHQYEKGKVIYAMRQKNELHVQVTGGAVNATY